MVVDAITKDSQEALQQQVIGMQTTNMVTTQLEEILIADVVTYRLPQRSCKLVTKASRAFPTCFFKM